MARRILALADAAKMSAPSSAFAEESPLAAQGYQGVNGGCYVSPLFVKYETKTGNRYVYDVRTGEILRVSEAVYEAVDYFHVLTADEIHEKLPRLSREAIQEAIAELDGIQKQGLLCAHRPEPTVQVESLLCRGEPEPVRDFLRHRRRLLTLELTHGCNLACEYCIFGQHYEAGRRVSPMPMSLDTAKRAVAEFLSGRIDETVTIGFYGGEPLLEFELLKKVVAFVEELATQKGCGVRFNMSTNGTLLSEAKIHYLVAHQFSVLISIDGDRHSHDRYRVFKGDRHKGSFDIIQRNMERFVELYPVYITRGLLPTLTATTDVAELERFLDRWKESFPVIIANSVAPVEKDVEPCLGLGCSDPSCGQVRGYCAPSGEILEFVDWPAPGFASAIERAVTRHASELCRADDTVTADEARQDDPLGHRILSQEIEHIHTRSIIGHDSLRRPTTRMSCFPGASRTYCSVAGAIYPCEKVEFTKFFEIGDATNGVDGDKAFDSLIEQVRLGFDCGNCILNQICTVCPASVRESQESPGGPDYLALRRTCGELASEPLLAARLRRYTELMETNPTVLDGVFRRTDGKDEEDWLGAMEVLTSREQANRRNAEVGLEELAEVD
ncbi:MAG: radical SAM protein [Planctomycetaceae bacterium]|nr:MAG: radical SAM protein [Planctomycetaceae bacterium]